MKHASWQAPCTDILHLSRMQTIDVLSPPGLKDRDATVRAKALSSVQQAALCLAEDAAGPSGASGGLAAQFGIVATVSAR